GMIPPAQVLSRGCRALSSSSAPAASAGAHIARRSAVAAPAGPAPTMIASRRSTTPSVAKRGRPRQRSRAREQTLSGHVVHLQPDAVRILEEHRVISRRPRAVLGRMHDGRPELADELVGRIDVRALARPEAEMVQPDTTLHEALSLVRLLGRRDAYRGAAADAVEEHLRVEHGLQP